MSDRGDVVDVDPTCPKCGEETYPTMMLLTNGKCQHCGAQLTIVKAKETTNK